MEPRRNRVQIDGLELSFLEAGAGPPVLFLHGWPTQAALWRHVLPAVGRTHRAIALDLPGFGQSSKPLDASYSFRFYDAVITGFLDHLGVDDIGLVVHDLGGPLGVHWAVQNVQRVRELVLLNTLVFPEMSWAVKAFVVASLVPGVRHALSSPWGVERSMRFGVTDKSRITPAVAKLYRDPFVPRPARKALLKAAHGLHPKGFDTITERLPGLADIPTFLLYGEADRILPDVARTMDRVQTILPHAQRKSLPGCGHFLQEDQPEAVAEALGEFFASVAP